MLKLMMTLCEAHFGKWNRIEIEQKIFRTINLFLQNYFSISNRNLNNLVCRESMRPVFGATLVIAFVFIMRGTD